MFKLINKKDIKNYLKENNIDKISKRIIIDPIYPLNYKQSKRKGNVNQTIPFILEVLDKFYIIFNKNFIINEI
jgi:5,10-methenyltetrahydromethanopterin hydrogenase